MRNKIIISLLILFIIVSNVFCISTAYSGEIDPNAYIMMPMMINSYNHVADCTISVTSAANSYQLYYQKVDITDAKYDEISKKADEVNSNVEKYNEESKKKYDALETLRKQTESILSDSNKSEEEKDAAQEKYKKERDSYNNYVDTEKAKINKLKMERQELVPNFTNSWTKTTLERNNVTLDFSKYSGEIHFVLWAKLENGTNTYYDYQIYSTNIKNNNEPGTGEDEKPQNGEWTDFSKSKLTTEPTSNVRDYRISISNATPIENHIYRYAIGDGKSTPEYSDNLPQLSYDKEKKVFYSTSISKYLELGPDQYLYIYEQYFAQTETKNNLVLEKKKIEKPAQKKYTDAFFATMISKLSDTSDCDTQILFNTPWDSDTVRKVHIKIGKINDDTILKNIYDKKSNAFEGLQNYAIKDTKAFYDKTLDSTEKMTNAGGVKIVEKKPLFPAENIIDKEYYYLYAVVEDENGKYVKTEGVTLARATKTGIGGDNSFSLFFYGSDDFSWRNFNSGDNTVAPGNLPDAGAATICLAMLGIVILVGIISYRKYKKCDY